MARNKYISKKIVLACLMFLHRHGSILIQQRSIQSHHFWKGVSLCVSFQNENLSPRTAVVPKTSIKQSSIVPPTFIIDSLRSFVTSNTIFLFLYIRCRIVCNACISE